MNRRSRMRRVTWNDATELGVKGRPAASFTRHCYVDRRRLRRAARRYARYNSRSPNFFTKYYYRRTR